MLFLSLSAPAGAAGPSFDCKATRKQAEKAICANPVLSALDLRIASAYRTAFAALDPKAQAALRTDQRLFVEARDSLFGTPYYDLKEDLEDRAALLESLDLVTRSHWEGRWVSVMGEIEIVADKDGRQARISTVALTMSHPMCQLEVSAMPQGEGLVAGGLVGERRNNEGWTVRLTRKGDALHAELVPPEEKPDGGPPFCGLVPSISGAFFPVKRIGEKP